MAHRSLRLLNNTLGRTFTTSKWRNSFFSRSSQVSSKLETETRRVPITENPLRLPLLANLDSPQTLSDTYGRFHNYLRISVTERCNLRCTYCMAEEGVPLSPQEKLITTEEIVRIARIFVQEGVDKIRLTGGEPTVRKDILELVRELGRIPGLKTLAMTTNGLVLHRKLEQLMESGLNMLNVSLDTLDPDKFVRIARRPGFEHVMKSIRTAIDLGVQPLKINVVVQKGINDNEICDFVDWTRRDPIEVRFIEYMPFDGNTWSDDLFVPYQQMISMIKQHFDLQRSKDGPNNTSKTYQVPGFPGKVGFISSMSNHFCGSCNRLRLMADGSLKVCLFGSSEVSLRDILRQGGTNEQLMEVISMAVKRKMPSHGGMYNIDANKKLNRPMVLIGG
eukprot:TRINITY_DN1431_c0_g1_i1.p1 TRINITY_DN1431_c0_g1~~TRINITY_DN1431_c0_g1_i1.p1  ORF type:complete len:391 (-),score=53.82 TRINITY_DN1431_c0_g1_i1:70-1242(-)